MNKWFNKQKPITLGFITAVLCTAMMYFLSYLTEAVFDQKTIFKLCGGIGCLMFFMSWGLFSMAKISEKTFDDILDLYISAKKAKTKEQLETVEETYKILRTKCQHQNHYSKMNEIWQIIQTKKEFL